MIYRPPRGLGFAIGLLLTLWSAAVGVVVAIAAVSIGIEFEGFLVGLAAIFFFLLAALFAYWSVACLNVAYIVDRNGLAIQWGNIRQLVPLDQIQKLVPGASVRKPRIRGVGWWGHHVGQGVIRGIGHTLFYSTHRSRRELLYVVTPSQSYGICVNEPVLFAREIQNRQAMGAVQKVRQAPVRNLLGGQAFWLDRRIQFLLAFATLLCLSLYGYVFWVYPGLNETISVEFPSLGGVVRLTSKSELLDIPNAALGVLVLDVVLALIVHLWQRLLAYIVLLGAAFSQVIFIVAAVIAVN
ncbi:MAG TPA: PH domain-containing protein [Dehalococcoidia bacterium]|nr:PH domain-containing protein [Dehalococcoidia bacterium]